MPTSCCRIRSPEPFAHRKKAVRYLRLPRLGEELALLQAQGRISHWLKTLGRIDLVIPDDARHPRLASHGPERWPPVRRNGGLSWPESIRRSFAPGASRWVEQRCAERFWL
jgi:hypothetical protein